MATTADYLTQLQVDKQTLVDNLVAKGVDATSDETFTTLAPKVADIPSGGSSFEITDASYLFYRGVRLDKINELCALITSECSDFQDMFYYAEATETPLEIPLFNTSGGTNFYRIFHHFKGVKELPQIDTSNGTRLEAAFSFMENLTTLPLLDFSKANNINSVAYWNQKLVNVGGFKNLGKAFTEKTENYSNYKLALNGSTSLTHDSLMNVINNLYDLNLTYDVANGGTLYAQSLVLGSTLMALLSEDELLIAQDKGWEIS